MLILNLPWISRKQVLHNINKVPTSYFNLGNKRVLHENTNCDKEIEEGTGENG